MKERDTGGNKYVLKKGYRKYTVFQAEGSFKVVKKSLFMSQKEIVLSIP